MLIALAILTDGLRWWGALASVFIIADLVRSYREWHAGHGLRALLPAGVEHIVHAGLALFLPTVGLMVPMVTRATGYSYTQPNTVAIFAIGWVGLGTAAWALVVGHAGHKRIALATAALALVMAITAAWLTAVHA